MSVWRRKAIEIFPDLRAEFQSKETSIYGVFFELLPRCIDAHRRKDEAEFIKIYGYAEWCFAQKAKDLWNAAGVAFYEHLGDQPETLDELHLWIKPEIFREIEGLLEWSMSYNPQGAKKFATLKRKFEER